MIAFMQIFAISTVTIVGMLEPETVTIFELSESPFAPNASSFLGGFGGCAGGGSGAGAREICVMVEGGCSVAVHHGVRGKCAAV